AGLQDSTCEVELSAHTFGACPAGVIKSTALGLCVFTRARIPERRGCIEALRESLHATVRVRGEMSSATLCGVCVRGGENVSAFHCDPVFPVYWKWVIVPRNCSTWERIKRCGLPGMLGY